MTRIALFAVALGAAVFAAPASAAPMCTDVPLEQCYVEYVLWKVPCIPSGDLEGGCPSS